MSNQEAITIIGNLEDKDIFFNPCDVQEAKTMAIKALEQEPKTDVLDKIRERISLEKLGYPPSAGYYKAIVKVLQIIDKYRAGSEDV